MRFQYSVRLLILFTIMLGVFFAWAGVVLSERAALRDRWREEAVQSVAQIPRKWRHRATD
jgi:hypothetical protein